MDKIVLPAVPPKVPGSCGHSPTCVCGPAFDRDDDQAILAFVDLVESIEPYPEESFVPLMARVVRMMITTNPGYNLNDRSILTMAKKPNLTPGGAAVAPPHPVFLRINQEHLPAILTATAAIMLVTNAPPEKKPAVFMACVKLVDAVT